MKKVVLITGGASGIGKKIVEDFARNDYDIAFSYFTSEQSAIELKNKLVNENCNVFCDKLDISKDEQIKAFVNKIIDNFGHIDVLINNAATTNDTLFHEKDSSSFERVLKTNLIGTFVISKLVGEIMYKQKSGKIINISSTNGMDTYFPMCLEYDASKAGLNSLTHNLSMQFAPYVNVNAIAPGFIGTENELKDIDEEYINSEIEKIFVKRLGTPEDVSNLALFLASDKADFINNQIIKINGGVWGD